MSKCNAGQCHLNTQLAHRMGYIFDNVLSMCVEITMLLAHVSPLVVIAIVSSSSKDWSLVVIARDIFRPCSFHLFILTTS